MKNVILAFAIALLTGCDKLMAPAPPEVPPTTEEIVASEYARVTVEKDPYTRMMFVRLRDRDWGWKPEGFLLVYGESPGKPSLYSIATDTRRADWLFLESCYDSDGVKLKCASHDRLVGNHQVEEIMAIDVDRAYLNKHAEDGVAIKLLGKRGESLVKIGRETIRAFLRKVDEVRAESGASAETTTTAPQTTRSSAPKGRRKKANDKSP
jgi:hypothetical protein